MHCQRYLAAQNYKVRKKYIYMQNYLLHNFFQTLFISFWVGKKVEKLSQKNLLLTINFFCQ